VPLFGSLRTPLLGFPGDFHSDSSRCQIGDAEPTSVYAAERGRKLSIAADQVRL